MNVRTVIAILIMGGTVPAFGEYLVAINAVETSSSLVEIPNTPNSSFSFKSCKECDSISLRLTSATQFTVRGERIAFDNFRRAFKNLRRDDEYVLVSYDVRQVTATSIRVAD